MPGYDYAAEMGKLGHVSLTLDELGYGASGHPKNGNETCQGAEADITHQIVQKLRHGAYTLAERPGIEFSSVVLAGHDVGGEVAEIEAHSYEDVNGLMLVTFAEQGLHALHHRTVNRRGLPDVHGKRLGLRPLHLRSGIPHAALLQRGPARHRSRGRPA